MNRSPLIAYMLTPQAAPETLGLKRLRVAWMGLCWALAGGVIGIRFWVALFGLPASAVILLLGVSALVAGIVYFTRKMRADDRWATRKDAS